MTIDEVLALRHPDGHRWSPDGSRLAFLWHEGGANQLWVADVASGELKRCSEGTATVSDFDWRPGSDTLVYAQGDDIWVLEPGRGPRRITETPGREGLPRWSPDGSLVAFVREGGIWLWRPADGYTRALELPGRVAPDAHAPGYRWSPDGKAIAFAFIDGERRDLGVVCLETGRTVWRTRTDDPETHFVWLDGRRLYFTVTRDTNRRRDHYLMDLGPLLEHSRARVHEPGPAWPQPRLVHVEEERKGLLFAVEPQVSPAGDAVLLVLGHSGWDHLYVLDVASGALRQLTDGECEDVGHAYDLPRWSPDGRRVLFASNRTDPGHRQLWTVDAASGALTQLTDEPGTSATGIWSPDGRHIAYAYCGPYDPADLWLMEADGSAKRQLTRSLPATWTREKMIAPEHVTFASAGGWEIHGYLYRPPDLEPGRRYPALVWVHGGPIRQMRDGWHPMHSYAIFHAFTQYLCHRGYVSLCVNFRGGIGYGRAFEQGTYLSMAVDDAWDVVNAGRYLKSLPYVDPERVGVWGISYGGYMTLAVLTKHPDEFRVGVNLAGIWDEKLWVEWAERHYRNAAAYFVARLGGREEERPEVWHNASPRHWVHQMKAPLINLHGTRDEAVPFNQLDAIVKDCVEHGKTFETHYYPDEPHVFVSPKTWRDAFGKIERAFDRHLKGAG